MQENLDIGYLVEGTVERDPMTDRVTIRTVDADGKPIDFDPSQALAHYVGKEVRFTLASFETLDRLAELAKVEEGGAVPLVGVPVRT